MYYVDITQFFLYDITHFSLYSLLRFEKYSDWSTIQNVLCRFYYAQMFVYSRILPVWAYLLVCIMKRAKNKKITSNFYKNPVDTFDINPFFVSPEK